MSELFKHLLTAIVPIVITAIIGFIQFKRTKKIENQLELQFNKSSYVLEKQREHFIEIKKSIFEVIKNYENQFDEENNNFGHFEEKHFHKIKLGLEISSLYLPIHGLIAVDQFIEMIQSTVYYSQFDADPVPLSLQDYKILQYISEYLNKLFRFELGLDKEKPDELLYLIGLLLIKKNDLKDNIENLIKSKKDNKKKFIRELKMFIENREKQKDFYSIRKAEIIIDHI